MSKDKKTDAAAQEKKLKDEKSTPADEIKEETKPEEPEKELPEEDTAREKAGGKESGAEEKKEESAPDLKAEMAVLTDKYLRICAEYDNFRKRSQKERDNLYGDIKAETLKSFLPVYDNLVRALAQSTEDEAYRKGVEMIMNQFNSTMDKLGVTEIDCLGKKFDPAFHNAVMHVEDSETGENEIVEVFQKGFMMGEKVIRFAVVKVAN